VTPDLALAHELADAADAVALEHFERAGLRVEHKPDGSPVTDADRAVEERICELLAVHRPDDGYFGEEVGQSGPSERRWIIDGIDGTHNYVRGWAGWGTLIALEDHGELVAGLMTSPALGRRWWAERARGAWMSPTGAIKQATPLRCTTTGYRDAVVVVTPPDQYLDDRLVPVAGTLRRRPPDRSSFAHAALTVAEGRTDAVVVLRGGAWDYAAVVVIVEEAGGSFSDLWGRRRLDTGTAAFTNGVVHAELLAAAAATRPETPVGHADPPQ
jgi:histidinol-phosphatase